MMADSLDNMWNTYNAVKDWIIFSDTKAGAIVAFYALFGSTFLPKFIEIKTQIFSSWLLSILWILIITFSSVSILFALCCLYPQKRVTSSHSLIFYRDIFEDYPSPQKYSFKCQKESYDDFSNMKDISGQVWALSKVATRKYDLVSYSIQFLIISFILFSLFVILIIILK